MPKEERESVLERALRLNKSRDIDRVFKKGQFANGELFRIRYLKNNSTSPRISVIVGLKFSKKAVHRNLIKRRVRAHIAKNTMQLGNFDIVIMPRPLDLKKFEYSAISKDLDSIFNRIVYRA